MNNTNTNTNNNNKNQNELGALWKKKSKTGMSFLSGYINDHDGSRTDIVIFANDKKTNEKAPDYRVYISKPLVRDNSTTQTVPQTKKVAPVKKVEVQEEVEDDIL